MAPAKKTTPLRQGTLSFASAKPTAATINAKQKSITTVPVAPTSSKKRTIESSSEDSDEIESSSTPPPAKAEGKTSKGQTLKDSAETRAEPVPFKSKDAMENSRVGKASEEVSRPELNLKDRKYNKHYMLVRDKMGRMPPIHGEGQTKIHEILRVFDLSDQYGPCIGVTRIERWERASMMGLNPPQEVYDILSTKQGATESQYIENVFHDQV